MQAQVAFELAIPPLSPESAPVRAEQLVGLPVLAGGVLTLPLGCVGIVGARLRTRYGQPIAPTYGGGWLTGEGERITLPRVVMRGPPWVVVLEGWSADDTFGHTITAQLLLESDARRRR